MAQHLSGGTRVAAGAPARADGVELLGELAGSGYAAAPGLVRRGDGQTLQLTPLLYAVLDAVDGERDAAAVADRVGDAVGRRVSADDVTTLLDKLRPLGVLRAADGSTPQTRRADPLLGLRFRVAVTDPERTRRLTAPFAALFTPLVLWPVLAVFAVTAGWLLFVKGLASATAAAFDSPGLLLLVVVFAVLSAGFHEFGHAAACRYGGATPGAMGAGLYLVWPAFYTDVDDSYRLSRGGRIRVDLGGLYFNALFAVATVGLWALVHADALLLLVVAQLLQMVRQLTPLVRFDGYHVLADLTGVPDLFSRIGPTLRGLLPWHWGRPETRVLRRWARVVVTAWVLVVVPLLLLTLAITVLALPRVVGTALAGVRRETAALGAAWETGDVPSALVHVFSTVAIALPLLGVLYVVTRTVRRTVGVVRRRTEGRPLARALAVLCAFAVVAALLAAWWPREGTYRPLQRGERGVVTDVLARTVPSSGTTVSSARAPVHASTVWVAPDGVRPPSQDAPALAVVLQPRDGEGPTWVFPFAPPQAPGADDNQAFALNRTDGGTAYEVSFALVWLDDHAVAPRNEAYALASCSACTTVAVAFQVVLVAGQADLAVPQNVAAAVNVACVQCLTYALATQLVLSVPEDLSDDVVAQIEQLWASSTAGLAGLSLTEVRQRIEDVSEQLTELVGGTAAGADAGADAAPRPSSTAATPPATRTTTSPTAGESASTEPSGEPSAESPPSSASPSPSPETSSG